MAKVTASIRTVPYKIEIKSPSGNVVVADEPVDKGGKDSGFSPKELLVSALAACTCATLRIYCNHKGWELEKVDIEIELTEEGGQTTFTRKLSLTGNLDQTQRTRLLGVANACPVHKILTHPIKIETELV